MKTDTVRREFTPPGDARNQELTWVTNRLFGSNAATSRPICPVWPPGQIQQHRTCIYERLTPSLSILSLGEGIPLANLRLLADC